VIAPTVSDSVLVDSSGWVDYFGEAPKAGAVAPYLEGTRPVIVPTIVIYEVYKKLRLTSSKTEADRFASQALRRQVIPLDEELALTAAAVSLKHKLAMADAIIYATAQSKGAELVTSDRAFEGLPDVTLL
jgi:predicted nucleic acid-binding protein